MIASLTTDLHALCQSALQVGIAVLIQSTLLVALGLACAAVLRRRGPALNSCVLRGTLAAVLLTALLAVWAPAVLAPRWQVDLPDAAPASWTPGTLLPGSGSRLPGSALGHTQSREPARASAVTAGELAALPGASSSSRPLAPSPPRPLPSSPPLAGIYVAAAAVWGVGTLLLLAWLGVCHLCVLWLRGRCAPVSDPDTRATLRELCAALRVREPALLAGPGVRSPFLWGLGRPAIFLPAAYATTFDAEAIRAILAHELAHLARRDAPWNLLARVAGALLWTQPLLWVLLRRMEQAAEEVCDQVVIQQQCAPRVYAACLVDLAERFLPRPAERALGTGVAPGRSSLSRRVQQILTGSRGWTLALSRRARGAVAAGVLAAVIGGALLISGAVERPAAAAPEEEPMARGPVTGRVLTPDGTPVKGATVHWISRISPDQSETHVRASVTTDEAGRFRFGDADRLRTVGERPQLVTLSDGWGLAFRDLPRDQSVLELSLEPAVELRVPLLDPAGKPAADLPVNVELVHQEWPLFLEMPAQLAGRFAARTDAAGIATITGLPMGYRVRLGMNDPRYAKLTSEDRVLLEDAPVTQARPIRLVLGASLEGRITYQDSGRPAAGIRVGAQGVHPNEGWGEAVADGEGRYQIRQLKPGSYNIALDLKGDLATSWTARAHERLVVGAGEGKRGIDFTLIPGALITGRVLAADNGEPIAGQHIGIYGPAHPRSGAWVQGTVTGPDGRYAHRVPGGKQHLYLSSAAPSGFDPPARTSHDLTVADGETVTIDFRLPRGRKAAPIQGQVIGPDGKPAAGAEVEVVSSDRYAGSPTMRQTDASGAFTLDAQLAAKPVLLRARKGTMATARETVALDGDTVTLRLERGALAGLSGRVTDTAGRPIAGVTVTLFEQLYESGRSRERVVTDAQGGYAFSALWSGSRYSVLAEAKGYGQAWSPQIDAKQGKSETLAPLALKNADQVVAGRVVDASGEPVAGATVYIHGRDTRQQGTTTDAQGRFRFEGVVAERVSVQSNVGAPGQFASKSVPAGSLDVVLVLPAESEPPRPMADDQLAERFAALGGKPAPALETVGWVNSPPRTMAQLKGKVVLIDFWGVSCGPCMAALPAVQRTAERFGKRGVVVVGLHDASGSVASLKALAKRNRLTYAMAIDAPAKDAAGKTFAAYGIQAIPSVAVIDRDGKVAYIGPSLAEAVGVLGRLAGG